MFHVIKSTPNNGNYRNSPNDKTSPSPLSNNNKNNNNNHDQYEKTPITTTATTMLEPNLPQV